LPVQVVAGALGCQDIRGKKAMQREYVEIAWSEVVTALLTMGIMTFLWLV
jgi:hypothetical protein